MLYQEYRDTDDALEPQIQALLEFARQKTTQPNTSSEGASLFADVEQSMSDDELAVLSAYRNYQQSRELPEDLNIVRELSDDAVDAKVGEVLAHCEPALKARVETGLSDAGSRATVGPASLLTRLGQRLMPASRPWSMPVGAVAAVALAVVALSLFKAGETGNTMIALTGVPSYQQAVDLPLNESLPAPTVAAMAFSPADAQTAKAYAIGSLTGELAIAVAGNDKERSLQTISRIELLDRASPDAGDDSTIDLTDKLNQTRTAVTESAEAKLLKDDAVVDALGSLMSAVRGTGASDELASLQKLGSWTLIALTLLNASENQTNAAWRRDMLSRVMADAETIHGEVLSQSDLTDAQREALEAFQQFAKDRDTDAIQADGLRAMNDITRRIDTSFRI